MLPSSLLSEKTSRIKWSLSMCHNSRLADDNWTGSVGQWTFKFHTKNAVKIQHQMPCFNNAVFKYKKSIKHQKYMAQTCSNTKTISKLGKACNTFMKVSFFILTSVKIVCVLSYKFTRVTRWTLSLCIHSSFCNIFFRMNSFITKPYA